MNSAGVILGGVAFHAAKAMSGIALKRVLARHEISKNSDNAPTFLIHGFVVSKRETQVYDSFVSFVGGVSGDGKVISLVERPTVFTGCPK